MKNEIASELGVNFKNDTTNSSLSEITKRLARIGEEYKKK